MNKVIENSKIVLAQIIVIASITCLFVFMSVNKVGADETTTAAETTAVETTTAEITTAEINKNENWKKPYLKIVNKVRKKSLDGAQYAMVKLDKSGVPILITYTTKKSGKLNDITNLVDFYRYNGKKVKKLDSYQFFSSSKKAKAKIKRKGAKIVITAPASRFYKKGRFDISDNYFYVGKYSKRKMKGTEYWWLKNSMSYPNNTYYALKAGWQKVSESSFKKEIKASKKIKFQKKK